MSYQRQTERTIWVTDETPLNADNMNNIEDEIDEALSVIPVIHTSTSEPTSSDGNNGDFWFVIQNS